MDQMKQFQDTLRRQEEELQAVRRSAESSTGGDKATPVLEKGAPLDTTTYRGNDDMFVDDDSTSSDTGGKQQENADSEEEIDINVGFEDDDMDNDQKIVSLKSGEWIVSLIRNIRRHWHHHPYRPHINF